MIFDLHVHAALPFLGASWRRHVQGFRPAAWETATLRGGPPPGSGEPPVYGVSCYQTFLLGPGRARERLFRSLESFPAPPGSLILSSRDLDPVNLSRRNTREAFFLAVESLRYLRDPLDLRRLWDAGARSLQPIHFLDTPWGHSSREGLLAPAPGGLTTLGREMLAEAARLGFILDLAHMNFRTAADCLAAYPGPMMCSHTGLHEIRPNARNLPAELARELFRRGGAVGVTCWKRLLGKAPPPRGIVQVTERTAWTRSYCETVLAFAYLAADARVAVGSDRGAPIRIPGWFYSRGHLREMEECLSSSGWEPGLFRNFLSGHARAFLKGALPA